MGPYAWAKAGRAAGGRKCRTRVDPGRATAATGPARAHAPAEPDPDETNLSLQKLAFEVCFRINQATPITPTSLVTLALLGRGDRDPGRLDGVPTHEGDVATNLMMYDLMDTLGPLAYELVDAMETVRDDPQGITDALRTGVDGQAEDVARAVRFFLTPDNYVTGQLLTVDGGLTL